MNPEIMLPERSRSDLVETLYATAHALFEAERYAEASAVFRLMLQLSPADERTWLGLAQCHERIGQSMIALELYSAGSVAAEPAPRCMLGRARLLRCLDRDAEADDALSAASDLADAANDTLVLDLVAQERVLR